MKSFQNFLHSFGKDVLHEQCKQIFYLLSPHSPVFILVSICLFVSTPGCFYGCNLQLFLFFWSFFHPEGNGKGKELEKKKVGEQTKYLDFDLVSCFLKHLEDFFPLISLVKLLIKKKKLLI